MNLDAIQKALYKHGVDGWLFFDHHRRDPLAYKILGLPSTLQPTRRWYYVIPAQGEPHRLVHKIESHALDSVPGDVRLYSQWSEQTGQLQSILAGMKRICMQYSENCAIPYVSMVDAGTIELVRATGVEIVSSSDLVQEFEARWTPAQLESHLATGRKMDALRAAAFRLIGDKLSSKSAIDEWSVAQFLRRGFEENGLITDHGPIVAVNANASDPHYEPSAERTSPIESGDLVLIDMWAKATTENAVYYDITWTGYCGATIPDEMNNVFAVVSGARNAAVEKVVSAVGSSERIAGFEVDDVARQYIATRGYAEFFIHRTGHSIGTEVHGTGANMDNFETHDTRAVIPWTCFSVEPGVYLPKFGIRSEVNVFVGDTDARVTGEAQDCLLKLA